MEVKGDADNSIIIVADFDIFISTLKLKKSKNISIWIILINRHL